MCLILNLVYLVSQASQLDTAIQVKTHFRINCRFSLPFSCIVFKVPSHSKAWLFWSLSRPFPPALLSAQLIYHKRSTFVNTFFEVFFTFFDAFLHFRTLFSAVLGSFVFLPTSWGSCQFLPQYCAWMPFLALSSFRVFVEKSAEGALCSPGVDCFTGRNCCCSRRSCRHCIRRCCRSACGIRSRHCPYPRRPRRSRTG